MLYKTTAAVAYTTPAPHLRFSLLLHAYMQGYLLRVLYTIISATHFFRKNRKSYQYEPRDSNLPITLEQPAKRRGITLLIGYF